MKCKLVDVFARKQFSGNGLTIFFDCESLKTQDMFSLTKEMRQFESIFVTERICSTSVRARIFTAEEELDFAGHPILGLAAHLHEETGDDSPREWNIQLNEKLVSVKTHKTESYYHASMGQGKPEFLRTLNKTESNTIVCSLNLNAENMSRYPLEVVSTGLPYLIVPIVSGIENARITDSDFEVLLGKYGAKFVYVLDIKNLEGRHWENDGSIEDIATASAVGPVLAYLHKHELAPSDEAISISQGRFVGRPSVIVASIEMNDTDVSNIWVSGEIVKVADISFVQTCV
jgi:trans-2,3-dihydro-3-hydroxyanthranilate isomerase